MESVLGIQTNGYGKSKLLAEASQESQRMRSRLEDSYLPKSERKSLADKDGPIDKSMKREDAFQLLIKSLQYKLPDDDSSDQGKMMETIAMMNMTQAMENAEKATVDLKNFMMAIGLKGQSVGLVTESGEAFEGHVIEVDPKTGKIIVLDDRGRQEIYDGKWVRSMLFSSQLKEGEQGVTSSQKIENLSMKGP